MQLAPFFLDLNKQLKSKSDIQIQENDKFIENGYEIQKYTKDFLRTCIRDYSCVSGSYTYNIDDRRTRHPYELYIIKDDTYVKKIIESSKELNICGFIFLSIENFINIIREFLRPTCKWITIRRLDFCPGQGKKTIKKSFNIL